jgi:two-component system nitrogen regulation response regulator GlnG
LVDIKMPGLDGLEVLSKVRQSGSNTPIVIITGQITMANAIEAMKRGAYDYVTKPFDIEEMRLLVQRVLEMRCQTAALRRLEEQGHRYPDLGVEIIGKSPAMQEIFKTIGRVASSDATVLIQGESGTGKELIARAIHSHSPRQSAPFVALNCSAVPPGLLESELFGHERGAFTGATERRAGVFEAAASGTLLLDEIADMPLELQAKLLRVVQEKELTRIGGHELFAVDCRLIAATNQDLQGRVSQGRFREDLYFRLKVVPIDVPPLRQRRGDIPDLINYFTNKINRDMGTNITGVSPEARAILDMHCWPGNVRELENVLLRAAVLAPGPTLMPQDLVLAPSDPASTADDDMALEDVVRLKLKDYFQQNRDLDLRNLYPRIMRHVERPLIELVLVRTHGNQVKAAAILGINRNTLHKKIAQLGIAPTRLADDAGWAPGRQ